MGRIKDIWEPLKPEKKRRISVAVILLVLIGFAAFAYQLRTGKKAIYVSTVRAEAFVPPFFRGTRFSAPRKIATDYPFK